MPLDTLRADPGHAESIDALATHYERADRLAGAFDQLGHLLGETGDHEGAAAALANALKYTGGAVALRKHLARALLRVRRPAEAGVALQTVEKVGAGAASTRVLEASGDEPVGASDRFGPEPVPSAGSACCGECLRDQHDARQSGTSAARPPDHP